MSTNIPNNARLTAWPRLAAAARSASDTGDMSAPYGFAVRVAALALGQRRAAAAPLLVKYAFRALGIACLVAILSIGLNLGSILSDINNEATILSDASTETADIDMDTSALT